MTLDEFVAFTSTTGVGCFGASCSFAVVLGLGSSCAPPMLKEDPPPGGLRTLKK